jgi:hypothetical protein
LVRTAKARSWGGRVLNLALLCLVCLMMMVTDAFAETRQGPGEYRGSLYGRFCKGSRRGGAYGAKDPVRTAEEAREIISICFATTTRPLRVGRIEDKEWYFVVEIRDLNGETVDLVIMDKRSGRIRSVR